MEPGVEESSNATAPTDWPRDEADACTAGDHVWLRRIADESPVGIFRADANGRFIYVNARWCELTGRSAMEALESAWDHVIHPGDAGRVRDEWIAMMREGRPLSSECRFVRPDGSVVWVLARVMTERNDAGGTLGSMGMAADITELRKVREELQHARAQLEERAHERAMQLGHMAMIVSASDDAILSCDRDGRVVSWNKGAERIFGYTAAEMMGKSPLILSPAERLEESRALTERVRAGEDVSQFETLRVSRTGEKIDVSISIHALRDAAGLAVGTSAIICDIRERRKAERRLRQLSWRLLRTQDLERRRVARELHDSTAQTVAALAMNLSLLNRKDMTLPEKKRAALLADSAALADQAVGELRTQSYLLHPPLLDERGLDAALRWFVEGFTARSGIWVELELDPGIARLHEELEMTIFRVVQEGLANVHRHAKSPTARIRLVRDEGWIVLEIRDSGCGIRGRDVESPGVGVAGMRERLLQIGGTLHIESNNDGTALTARLPGNL
jgi:PAS domain S-box-containing protein